MLIHCLLVLFNTLSQSSNIFKNRSWWLLPLHHDMTVHLMSFNLSFSFYYSVILLLSHFISAVFLFVLFK